MRMNVIITGHYEMADDQLVDAYGTDDPVKCAELDERGNLEGLLALCDDVRMEVRPDQVPSGAQGAGDSQGGGEDSTTMVATTELIHDTPLWKVRRLDGGWYQGETALWPGVTSRTRDPEEARRWISEQVRRLLAENGYVPSQESREEVNREVMRQTIANGYMDG